MGKIFDVIKAHQISLGEFVGEIDKGQGAVDKTAPEANREVRKDIVNSNETKGIDQLLEINPLMLENLKEVEKPIYAIGIYIMESLGKFIFDSTDAHRRMSYNRCIIKESEYKVLAKIENGQTSDDELAFRYISIIHQMVYRNDKNIKVDYTPVELVAAISDPESKGIPIIIRFTYKEDGSQALEKANKLQVSKAGGSGFNK